jgi:hypothetical protein
MSKTKGHWPRNRRRHPTPPYWRKVISRINQIVLQRRGRELAHGAGVHRDTIRRWQQSIDLPSPERFDRLVGALKKINVRQP